MTNSLSLPSLSIIDLVAEKNRNRFLNWEMPLEENQQQFSDEVAFYLAQRIIKKLETHLKDPYTSNISKKNKWTMTYSLDLTESKVARQMKKQLKCDYPPFKEWIEHFSENETEFLDKVYFQQLMEPIGKEVTRKVNELLSDFQSSHDHRFFEYEMCWYSELKSENGRSKINVLKVPFWLDQKWILLEIMKQYKVNMEDSSCSNEEPLIDLD